MPDGSQLTSVRERVSAEEWQARVELAALYRLVHLYGWDDLIYTHISGRVPGPEHHFLINAYGVAFDEMTASDLLKVDLDGNVLDESSYMINVAGFVIHSAVHAARDDARFVMHLHSDDGAAVAAQEEGLLPLTQHALIIGPQVAYHDYEGVALNLDERERLVADLGDKSVMLLRNHGTLALGPSAADCFARMYYLERACTMQVRALTAGRDRVRLASPEAQDVVAEQRRGGPIGALAWPALLRKLDRELPGYDR